MFFPGKGVAQTFLLIFLEISCGRVKLGDCAGMETGYSMFTLPRSRYKGTRIAPHPPKTNTSEAKVYWTGFILHAAFKAQLAVM